MVRSPRIAAALVALALTASVATGCAFGHDRQASAGEAVAPDEVRIAVTEPVAIDPPLVAATDSIGVLATDLLFDGLTRSDRGRVGPELAASWESADGDTWLFHLDPTRRWSNGKPANATDVVASLERTRAMVTTSLAAGRLDQVKEIAAVDDHTVRITLSTPNRELPALLADPAYGIVPVVTNPPAVASDTVTSGRYRVRTGGADGATLVPVDPSAVHVKGVQFVHVADEKAGVTALDAGLVDIAGLPAKAAPPRRSTVVAPSSATLVLEVAATSGPLADTTNRASLAAALDRGAIAKALTGDADRATSTLVATAPPCGGECVDPAAGADPKVIASLKPSVRLDVPEGLVDDAEVRSLVDQLSSAGLDVAVRRGGSAELAAHLASGEIDLLLFAVVGTAPTPDPYVAAVLGSTGGENVTGFASASFDDALAAARSMSDDGGRRHAYEVLERTALADGAVIPLVSMGRRFAVSSRLRNVASDAGRLFDGAAIRIR